MDIATAEKGPIQSTLAKYLDASLHPEKPILTTPSPIFTKFYRQAGYLTEDQDDLHMGKICNTPWAKQCRFCKHDWHRRFHNWSITNKSLENFCAIFPVLTTFTAKPTFLN